MIRRLTFGVLVVACGAAAGALAATYLFPWVIEP